ncbi:alpha/beta fold hydrolase [Primorskyibacter sp. S87]|uniref:alpha/beta fold hydrolase n=1 Tax=Primorskyibacter sp. S87 TaxID=3415126 RepID=UPI003C7D2210
MAYFTTKDGIQIYFEDTGSGRPVLCLAGLTRCSRDFSYFAPYASDLRLISMDYRGRGKSDYDPDYLNYNVLREAQDVLELLDHLGLEQVAILGTSRGGLIAMTLAMLNHDRLSAVILNDIGPAISNEGIARIMEYVGKKPASKSYEDAANALRYTMEEQFPGVPMNRWLEQARILFDQTADGLQLRYDAALLTSLLEQAANGPAPDLWPLFQALEGLPSGVIRGANSDLLTEETMSEMQKRLPALITATVPDRGHVPFLDEPEALDLVRRVLAA